VLGVRCNTFGGGARAAAHCSLLGWRCCGVALPPGGRPASATLLVVGDSLSAEYGLARGSGWVALLEQRLARRSCRQVVNASVSGDTTSGGRSRLPALLAQHRPSMW
jgi:acyl-CoA thioesterase-1